MAFSFPNSLHNQKKETMKDVKIALLHCPKSSSYKLMKMTSDLNEDDPCIMWVFDASRFKMAMKIMKNMNIADKLNTMDMAFG